MVESMLSATLAGRASSRPGHMQLQAPLPRDPGTRVWSRLCRLKLGDHVDFDASAKWQLCHTDGAARMDAPLAEHLNKEFRRPIRNSVRFREVRCAVDYDNRALRFFERSQDRRWRL